MLDAAADGCHRCASAAGESGSPAAVALAAGTAAAGVVAAAVEHTAAEPVVAAAHRPAGQAADAQVQLQASRSG